jgi:hypothetical protein
VRLSEWTAAAARETAAATGLDIGGPVRAASGRPAPAGGRRDEAGGA